VRQKSKEEIAAIVDRAVQRGKHGQDDGREQPTPEATGASVKDKVDLIAEISRLAKLSPLDYEGERKGAAERLNVRASMLDRLVAAERGKGEDGNKQGHAINFAEPEPWAEPVDGTKLLDDLAASIRRHVVMTKSAAAASALWVMHSYLIDCFLISPRLAITSPEKQCGKTTLLDVLSRLVIRPLSAANASSSAIFRVVEMARPTLLIDEGDSFLSENEELRGILNSGHRRGGAVLRTVGDDHEPRCFATYGACAIALIGRLPGTLADRSISIALQRRRAEEMIEPFRADRTGHLDTLARRAMRWALDNIDQVRASDPEMPAGLFNRAADNWRPLLAIADAAGWGERAREACAELAGTLDDTQSAGVLALADVRDVFTMRKVDRMFSADLVEALVAIEGRQWAEWKNGRPITKNGLARLLRVFRIAPESVRVEERTGKGYLRERFVEAWDRYLSAENPPTPPFEPSRRHNSDEMGVSSTSATVTASDSVTVAKCEKPAPNGHCGGVTVQKGGTAEKGEDEASDWNGRDDETPFAPPMHCEFCGKPPAASNPVRLCAMNGHGAWVHQSCQAPWADWLEPARK
jgi:putative DNA primase/helicase